MRTKRSRSIRRATSPIVEHLELRMMLAATPLYWDPSQGATASGGSGTWDTSTTEWHSGSTTGPLVAWNNSGDSNGPFQAMFSAGTGQISIGTPVTVAQVTFSSSGYTVNSSSGSLNLSSGQQISLGSGITATINTPIIGSAGLTKVGSGLLVIGGSNTYTNQTNINAGTLQLASGGNLGATSNSLMINGGTLDVHGVNVSTGAITSNQGVSSTVVNNGSAATLTVSGAGTAYWGRLNDGTGPLSLSISSGNLLLYGTNSYSGTTTINSGAGLASRLSLGSGSVVDNGTFYFRPPTSGNFTFSNSISGSGSVTFSPLAASGVVMTLSGTNTYTGSTTIASNTVSLSNSTGLGVNSNLTIASGAFLDLNGYNQSVGSFTESGAVRDGTTSSTNPATLTITNGGSIGQGFQNSNGKLSIATSVTGTLTVPQFILNGYSLNVPWTIGSGTTLSGAIGSGAVVDNGTLSLTLTNLGIFGGGLVTYAVGNIISGTGNVITSSNGIVALSPSDTYTGTTTIQTGALSIQQSNSSNINVSSGATLTAAGSGGSVNGSITVQSGGIISPGASGTSILNAQSITLASGSHYNAVINSSSIGTGYDEVVNSASLNISGSVLNLSGARLNHAGDEIVLMNNSGSSAVTGTFSGLPEGSRVTLNGVTYAITYHGGTGNDVLLTDITQTSQIRLSGAANVTPGDSYQLGLAVIGLSSNPSFTINWGDGTASNTSAGSISASHTYSDAGNYSINASAIINGVSCTSSSFGLDSSFGTSGLIGASPSVSEADGLVVQPNGTSVIFDSASRVLEGFNSDGSVDVSFGSEGIVHLGLSTAAKSIAMDPTGNLYVAGLDGSSNLVVERVTESGLIDSSFGSGGNAVVVASSSSSALTGGVSLVVATVGTASFASEQVVMTFANSGAFEVARLFSSGSLDVDAGSSASGIFVSSNVSLAAAANVQSVIASDGNLLVAGNTASGVVMQQFDVFGGADSAFNAGTALTLTQHITALTTSSMGNVIVASEIPGTTEISQLNSNGSTGASFGSDGIVQLPSGLMSSSGVSALALQGNGDLLATGVNGGSVVAVEYSSDGSLDTTFGAGGVLTVPLAASGSVGSSYPAFQSDGQLVVAASTPSGTTPAAVVFRVDAGNQIKVGEPLDIVPYKLSTPLFAGTPVTLTATGEGLPGGSGSLSQRRYAGAGIHRSPHLVGAASADRHFRFQRRVGAHRRLRYFIP